MKTPSIIIASLFFGLASLQAQNKGSTMPADTDYTIQERGANHRVWQKTTYEQGPNGKVVPHVHKYTELASGMHYKAANGQWMESKEKIDPFRGGAIARQGQHQVIFANNLNSYGAIDLQTPDNQRIRSHVLGLMYSDSASGQAVMFAVVQDSQGQLVAENQVLYPNAFTGVKADVKYTYKRASFEQDVILREQPPSPETFGMNPDTTELEVVTEFAEAPQGKIIKREVQGARNKSAAAVVDQDMDWGTMRIVRGKAFELGQSPMNRGVATRKQFLNLKGRQVLLEKVRLPDVEAGLSKLPHQASNTKIKSSSMMLANLEVPEAPPIRTNAQPMKLASTPPSNKGYVLDYVGLNIDTNDFTFQGDTTYYVNGTCNLGGITTFEGGTVIKSGTDWYNFSWGMLNIADELVCKTRPYCPAIFTSANDNSVGETILGSSGDPATEDALNFLTFNGQNAALHDMRFSYCMEPAEGGFMGAIDIWNCQFMDVGFGVRGFTDAILRNVLFVRPVTEENCAAVEVMDTIVAENVTADGGYAFATADQYSTVVALTNCIITGQPIISDYGNWVDPTTNCIVWLPSPDGPIYQTVGGGSYYLADNSPYRNVGTTNINPTLLAELAQKTTHPPIVFSNVVISVATNFSIQASRDNIGAPDLGYHYDPLDYVFGGVEAGGDFTFASGTAVGWFDGASASISGQGFGIDVRDNVGVHFNGTVTKPCILAQHNLVQEGGNGNWEKLESSRSPDDLRTAILGVGYFAPALVKAQYIRCYLLAGDSINFNDYGAYYNIYANNCEFINGSDYSYYAKYYLTNCLFDHSYLNIGLYGDIGSNLLHMCNCTMHGGSLIIQHSEGAVWPVLIANSAFDGTAIQMDNPGGNTNITYCDYNAFLINADHLAVLGTHDLTNIVSFNWQASWLGDFYLPDDSTLIDAGNTNANLLGFYQFTTQVYQTKETNSLVDIGYHYVAVDYYTGVLVDTDGDGVPDYLEDANGNGTVDTGETDWQNAFDLGLKIRITRPRNGSSLP